MTATKENHTSDNRNRWSGKNLWLGTLRIHSTVVVQHPN